MNTTIRKAAKACLVTAASGLLCGQVAALLAQDGDGATAQPSTGVQVLQAQGYVPATRATTTADGSEPETPLQRELRKQFQQGKRDMPSFQLDDAPHTEGVTPSNADAAYGATRAPVAAPVVKAPAPKPNWFERTFHVGRGKRKPAPVAESDAPPAKSRNWFGRPSSPGKSATPDSRSAIAAAPAKQVPSASAPRLTAPPPTTGPAAQAQPALSQLREPAPLAPAPTARELTSNKVPKVTGPSSPSVDSQPMLDEAEMSDDGESLDLVETQPQAAEQDPQEVADRGDDASEEESPYSGVKISPNEAERNALAASAPDMADDDSDDALTAPVESPAELKRVPPAARTGIRPMEDDDLDDEDDDDDDTLSSAGSKPRTLAEAPVQKAAHLLEKSSTSSTATQVSGTAAQAPFSGLKGMCPVALKDSRKLIDAKPTIVSTYKGKTFAFATPEAKRAFDQNPQKYAPAGCGVDAVKLASGEKGVDGNLEHAAWYRGKLYLFSSEDSRLEFVDEPSKFVVED